jgi:hypothetical protein
MIGWTPFMLELSVPGKKFDLHLQHPSGVLQQRMQGVLAPTGQIDSSRPFQCALPTRLCSPF